MDREEWIVRFKNKMRPYVNDAETVEELELFLQEEAEMAYESVADFSEPEDAATDTVYAINEMS